MRFGIEVTRITFSSEKKNNPRERHIHICRIRYSPYTTKERHNVSIQGKRTTIEEKRMGRLKKTFLEAPETARILSGA